MNTEAKPTMAGLRAYRSAVVVIPSDATEEQRASGLIVPLQDDARHPTKRGVVTHVADDISSGPLAPGSVIFYTTGWVVMDVVVVAAEHIIGYLAEEDV